jgi:hypothetical protein
MPLVVVECEYVEQDSQGIDGNASHADLRALVRISVDGQPKGQFRSRVKQVVGSQFDEQIFEVSPPSGYDGPYDHAAFAAGIADYVRRLIGPDNAAVTVAPGVKGVQMQGNLLMQRWRFEFRAGDHGKSW